jgi:DNA-binding NtrC family response regulator
MIDKDALAGKKILIVDDEPDILKTLTDLLSMCVVTEASSFEEARKLMENEDFDMAILDIMGVDGYTLLEMANERNILAVMLTAHALNPDHTVKSFKKGAAYYIPKEHLANIATYLIDILEAKEKGKSPWWRWLKRFDAYYNKKFGPDWKKSNEEFWKRPEFWV